MGAMRGLPALRALHAYQKLGYSASIRRAQAHTASSGARTNLDGPEQMPKTTALAAVIPCSGSFFPTRLRAALDERRAAAGEGIAR